MVASKQVQAIEEKIKARTRSRGTGFDYGLEEFYHHGKDSIIEPGVKIFRPKYVSIGSMVYIGHECILSGYPEGTIYINDCAWIGPGTMIYAHHTVSIGYAVGIGPGVVIITDHHDLKSSSGSRAIINRRLVGSMVNIDDGADIGCRAVILSGVNIGECAQVGAGAVVTAYTEIPPFEIWAGVPAKKIGEVAR